MSEEVTLRQRALRDHQQWLGFLQPEGLVVSPAALVDSQVILETRHGERQSQFLPLVETVEIEDREFSVLPDFAAFLREFLEWPDKLIHGLSSDRTIPESLLVPLPELGETLAPSFALKDPKATDGRSPWLLLVKQLDRGTPLDREFEATPGGWSASPSRRFERLLRETRVPIGLLTNGLEIRLLYAPRGENSGSLTFPVGAMTETGGRPILAALHQLLAAYRLLAAPSDARLPALLQKSREYQATVSTELAEQVLAALYELLRGFQAANDKVHGNLLAEELKSHPDTIYHGLLTVLMRLVFLLYAEDRSLMPGGALYNENYSVHGLFESLRRDHEMYPDTMDNRFGGWARLLVLFRILRNGCRHPGMKLPARHGYLFDPKRFPFLEGKDGRLPLVPDGVLYRVLAKLLILQGERLSYRTLDVEQIGSVYETMMGFKVEVTSGLTIALKPAKAHGAPTPIDLESLLALERPKRTKWLAEELDQRLTPRIEAAVREATSVEALLAALESRISHSATPHPLPKGSMILAPTDERRRTGSHYTPRSLTEPMVRRTLEPILAELGPNPAPEEILDLKVCDMAVGSGAFLVEACRQLGDALVAAWQHHMTETFIPPDEDEVLHARRRVAQRCLYGVDKNPMAVDLAKLSLWLATLAKDHPFTFLDHNLRAGDALVGLTRRQLGDFHWLQETSQVIGQDFIEMRIESATKSRLVILESDEDLTSTEMKLQNLRAADEALKSVREAGDCVLAAWFSGKTQNERLEKRKEYLTLFLRFGSTFLTEDDAGKVVQQLRAGEYPVTPFHWEIEFPEVFGPRGEPGGPSSAAHAAPPPRGRRETEAYPSVQSASQRIPIPKPSPPGRGQREARVRAPGFDAIVGNPPFVGGQKITGALGTAYRDYLVSQLAGGVKGSSDLVAYFFLRLKNLLRPGGMAGLLATNTIAQGDTREVGLDQLVSGGFSIVHAYPSRKWPGEANLEVAHVWLRNGAWEGERTLDDNPVPRISTYLTIPGNVEGKPHRLRANESKSFKGTEVNGLGFVLEPAEAQALIEKDRRNEDVVCPYLNGEDLNSRPDHSPSRWVINFHDWPLEKAVTYPDVLRIVSERAKPEIDAHPSNNATSIDRKRRWWQCKRPAIELYSTISGLERVLVVSLVTHHVSFGFVPTGQVFAHKLAVFPLPMCSHLAVLQSTFHEPWARAHSSSLETRLNYSPSDCFETFPFPRDLSSLETIGSRYHEHRRQLMLTRQEGLTKTYNRFHSPAETSPDIAQLRALHVEMDHAVAKAYGWEDLDLGHGFHETKQGVRFTVSPEARQEILDRLLALNFERHLQEGGE